MKAGAPLAGVRVLEFGMNIAGPYAACILGTYGAEVIKVESPEGDSARAFLPQQDGLSALFASSNHGKRHVCVDLRRNEAAEVVRRLIGRSDVLIQNLRPGAAARLGIDAAAAHRVNPRLIHASIEAFYPADGKRPGYDTVVQAESGIMAMTGTRESGPVRIPAAMIDHVTGLWVASAVLAALAGERDRTVIEVSLIDVAIGLLNEKVANYLVDRQEPRPMGSGTSVTTPQEAYPTADGYLAIAAATDDFFRRLAEQLGRPVLGDARFVTQKGRLENRAALSDAITRVLASGGTADWYAKLSAAGIPVAEVRPLSQALARHAERSATGFLALQPSGPEVLAPPVRMTGIAHGHASAPAAVGAHTQEVLEEIGFPQAEIQRLKQVRAIG